MVFASMTTSTGDMKMTIRIIIDDSSKDLVKRTNMPDFAHRFSAILCLDPQAITNDLYPTR